MSPTTPDKLPLLLQVSAGFPDEGLGDVVFVHGLDGDYRTTWQSPDHPELFWPAMLASDVPNINIWSLGYDVSSSSWKGQTMPLVDRATNILTLLQAHQLGKRRTVFICHSLGGLLVKQMLRNASEYPSANWRDEESLTPEWRDIVAQTRGIVFLSTPHLGSTLANWFRALKFLLPSVSIDDAQRNASPLRDLNKWFRDNIGEYLRLSVLVFYEKKPTHGVLVVDDISADPAIKGVTAVPLDEDHHSICTPASKTAMHYVLVRDFIKSLLAPASPKPSENDDRFRRDQARLKKYYIIFDRPVFQTPCAFEGELNWVHEALGDVSAAMATGALNARDGKRLKEVDPISDIESEEARRKIGTARDMISQILSSIEELRSTVRGEREAQKTSNTPTVDKSAFHMEFELQNLAAAGSSPKFIRHTFDLMDKIDTQRNEMIKILNDLFAKYEIRTLPLINLSTEQLRLSESGIREYDWNRNYLRCHRTLLTLLAKAD